MGSDADSDDDSDDAYAAAAARCAVDGAPHPRACTRVTASRGGTRAEARTNQRVATSRATPLLYPFVRARTSAHSFCPPSSRCTAPTPPELVDAFYAKFGVAVCTNYGATELVGAVAGWSLDDFRAHWAEKRGAAGRVHANIAARIVDAASGAVLPCGAEGLLELKGEQLANGGQWLRTTDRAVLDADNFLFIRGRADNAIIRGGFKVQPDDVVSALQEHPAIREAAVVGVPDERLGAVPAAAIILKAGAVAPGEDELRAFLKQRLVAYQVPVHFRIVADFPRTPSMKPSAPGLQALFAG